MRPWEVYHEVDCNGDGVEDLTCRRTSGDNYFLLSGACSEVRPTAPESMCPAAFPGEQKHDVIRPLTLNSLGLFSFTCVVSCAFIVCRGSGHVPGWPRDCFDDSSERL